MQKFSRDTGESSLRSGYTDSGTFYYVRNDPAYSGLKQRRYDIPDPEIVELKVKKARLDDIIPDTESIDLIKIDVEGGELPVLRGAKHIILKHRPFIVFESGKGASDRYGTNGRLLFEYLVVECELEINTLDGFLTGQQPLTIESLDRIFERTDRYYFIAHRPLSETERIKYLHWYMLDQDSRLFALRNLAGHVARIEQALYQLRQLLPNYEVHDWGARETKIGQPVNVQPDGTSAIWIRARNVTEFDDVYVRFGEQRARGRATILGDLVTSEIPESVINEAGAYPVVLVEPSGRETLVGTFTVNI